MPLTSLVSSACSKPFVSKETPPSIKRIIVVEDVALMRELLVQIVREELKAEVVGTTARGEEAVELCRLHQPDLLLLDLELADGFDGVEVADAVRRHPRPPAILAISSHGDDYSLWRLDRLHVQGYVDKGVDGESGIRSALRKVAGGGRYFSPAFLDARQRRAADPWSFDKILTDREEEVLGFAGNGLSDAEIGSLLNIAQTTAKRHRHSLLFKTRTANSIRLMAYGIRLGIARVFRRRASRAPLRGGGGGRASQLTIDRPV